MEESEEGNVHTCRADKHSRDRQNTVFAHASQQQKPAFHSISIGPKWAAAEQSGAEPKQIKADMASAAPLNDTVETV